MTTTTPTKPERSTRDFHRWNGGATPYRSELSEGLRQSNVREKRLLQQQREMYDKQEKMSLTQMMKEKLQVEEILDEEEEAKLKGKLTNGEIHDDHRERHVASEMPILGMNGHEKTVNDDACSERGTSLHIKLPASSFARTNLVSAPSCGQTTKQRQRRNSEGTTFAPKSEKSAKSISRSKSKLRVKTAPPHRNAHYSRTQQFGRKPEERPKSAFVRLTEHYMRKTGPTVQEVRSRLREQFSRPVDERWPDIAKEMEQQRRALLIKFGGTPRDNTKRLTKQTSSLSEVRQSKSREEVEEEIRNLKNFDKELANQIARIQGFDTKQDGTTRLLGRKDEDNVYTSKWKFEEKRLLRLAETKEQQGHQETKMKEFLSHLEESGYIPKKRRFDINTENSMSYHDPQFRDHISHNF
ncbi:uncharacterized protein LOC144445129 [Glandiceps talaboti]